MPGPLDGLATAYRRNRIGFIASGAAVVGVGVAYMNVRRGAAPIVVQSPVSADTGATAASDLSAYQAGASAAGSGFDTGAALGSSALGLAQGVLGSLSDVAGTLAQSQADVAGSATGALADALGQVTTPIVPVYSSPPPLPPVAPPPGGTPIPPPPAPSTARWSVRIAKGATIRWYRVASSGCIQSIAGTEIYTGATMTSACQAPVARRTCDNRSGAQTAYVTTGKYAGRYIHVGVGGVTVVQS